MKKPAIPEVRATDDYDFAFKKAVRDNIHLLTGVRGGVINPLPSGASLDDVIVKINQIIERLEA